MKAVIWIQILSSVLAFAGAVMVSTAGWRGVVNRTLLPRFDRGLGGEQIGSVGSSAPLYPARWNWGWRLMYVGFALQVAAGILQLILS